jgi:hypothetical protein
VQEHKDERMRGLFRDVLAKAHLPAYSIALCSFDSFTPMILPIPRMEGYGFAVMLPQYVEQFSDAAVRGLIGHELGHVGHPMMGTMDFAIEIDADRRAAIWVGRNAVAVMLRTLHDNLYRFPLMSYDVVQLQIEYRLCVLNGEPLYAY